MALCLNDQRNPCLQRLLDHSCMCGQAHMHQRVRTSHNTARLSIGGSITTGQPHIWQPSYPQKGRCIYTTGNSLGAWQKVPLLVKLALQVWHRVGLPVTHTSQLVTLHAAMWGGERKGGIQRPEAFGFQHYAQGKARLVVMRSKESVHGPGRVFWCSRPPEHAGQHRPSGRPAGGTYLIQACTHWAVPPGCTWCRTTSSQPCTWRTSAACSQRTSRS